MAPRRQQSGRCAAVVLWRQTHTYGPQVRQLEVGAVHLQDVAPRLSEHVHAEAHPLLQDGTRKVAVGGEFSATSN